MPRCASEGWSAHFPIWREQIEQEIEEFRESAPEELRHVPIFPGQVADAIKTHIWNEEYSEDMYTMEDVVAEVAAYNARLLNKQ